MRKSSVHDDAPPYHLYPASGSNVRNSLSVSGIFTGVSGIVRKISRTATTLISPTSSTTNPDPPVEKLPGQGRGAVGPIHPGRFEREKEDLDGRSSCFGGVKRSTVDRSRDSEMFSYRGSSSLLAVNCANSEETSSPMNKSTPNRVSQLLPQFRKETSFPSKNYSDSVVSPLTNSVLPPYVSPFSGRIGEMPAVRLSPRPSPKPPKTEDRARPVTVKLSQPDPLRSPFQRCRSTGESDLSQPHLYHRMSSVDTVVEALRKRKRSGIGVDEDIEFKSSDDSRQPFKRRRSRDSLIHAEPSVGDSTIAIPLETNLSRGMKRPALHGESDDSDVHKDSLPGVNSALKKVCQNPSPVQSPLRHYACGAKNLIDASYSSFQRFEKRLRSENSRQSSSSSLHERSLQNAESRMTSRQTSPASSHISWSASQTHLGDVCSPAAPGSGTGSRPVSPLTGLEKFPEPTSQRLPLLRKDGNNKNRLTVFNSPSTTKETKLDSSQTEEAQTKVVLFTEDDLERDRLLLSSRANWILSEAELVDAKETSSDFMSQAASAVSSDIVNPIAIATASKSATQTNAGLIGQNLVTSGTEAVTNPPNVSTADTVVASNVLKSSSTVVPLSNALASSSSGTFVTSSNNEIHLVGKQAAVNSSIVSELPVSSSCETNSAFAASSSVGVLASSGQIISATCTNLQRSSSEAPKSTTDFVTGASTKLGGGDGLSDDCDISSKVLPSESAPSFAVTGMSRSVSTFLPVTCASADTSATFTFGQQNVAVNAAAALSSGNFLSANSNPKALATDSTKSVPLASPFVFGVQNSVLTGNKTDVPRTTGNVAGAALNLSTGTFCRDKKSGFDFSTGFGALTPGSVITSSISTASIPNSSTAVPADKLLSGNSVTKPAITNVFGSVAASQAATNGGFAFGNSGTVNATAVGFGSTGVSQTVAGGGFAFGGSGNSAVSQNAFSSGGFAFGATNTSTAVVGLTTPTASGSLPVGKPNVNGPTANGMGNPGFVFGQSTTMQTPGFGQLGVTQATANDAFNFAGTAQSSGSNNASGTSSTTQGASGGFSFSKSVTSANNSFVFGATSNVQANGSLPGKSNSSAQPQVSSSGSTGPFVFGKSGIPSAVTSVANAGFPGLGAGNALGNTSVANNFFGNNPTIASSFGNNLANVNSVPFGSGLPAASSFATTSSTSTPFDTNPAKGNPFNFSNANTGPFVNKISGVTVANNNKMPTASVPIFGSSGISAGNHNTGSFPQPPSSDGFASSAQPAPVFNFLGTKANTVAVSKSEGFVFGKSTSSVPTFSQNASGFAFNHSSGNNPSTPSNQAFNFQNAVQPAAPTQTPAAGFNFAAFGQMPTNGVPAVKPFSVGAAVTPSFSFGAGTPTARTNRGRKKTGR